MAFEPDQGLSPDLEIVDLPELIQITETEMQILETHLRDILMTMLNDNSD